MDHFMHAPIQWEMTLQCNVISHLSLAGHVYKTIPVFWSLIDMVIAHLMVWPGRNQSGLGITQPITCTLLYSQIFQPLSKHSLAIEYHIHIWQMSPQLSCINTCQMWRWFKEPNKYFWKIKIFLTEKIMNGALSSPTPAFYVMVANTHYCALSILLRSFYFEDLTKDTT